jgi:YiiM-like, 3-alpha helix domain
MSALALGGSLEQPRPHRFGVNEVARLYTRDRNDVESMRRAAELDVLPESWRNYFRRRVGARAFERHRDLQGLSNPDGSSGAADVGQGGALYIKSGNRRSRLAGISSPLTDSNRRLLLTMRCCWQPVATDGNGFGLFLPFSAESICR